MEKPSGFAIYADQLRAQEPQELFNQAKVMRELLDHPGWAVLRELAEYNADRLLDRADHGKVLDQAQYAALHGVRSGVRQTLDAPACVIYAAADVEKRLAEKVRQEA